MDLIVKLRAAFVHTANPQVDGAEDPTAFNWGELGAFVEHLRRPARGGLTEAVDGAPMFRERQPKWPFGRLTKNCAHLHQIPSEQHVIDDLVCNPHLSV